MPLHWTNRDSVLCFRSLCWVVLLSFRLNDVESCPTCRVFFPSVSVCPGPLDSNLGITLWNKHLAEFSVMKVTLSRFERGRHGASSSFDSPWSMTHRWSFDRTLWSSAQRVPSIVWPTVPRRWKLGRLPDLPLHRSHMSNPFKSWIFLLTWASKGRGMRSFGLFKI